MLQNAVEGPSAWDMKPKPKAKRGKGKKQQQSEDEASGDAGEEGPCDKSMADLQADDPDMFEIAQKHQKLTGKLAPCFFQLHLRNYLRGDKNTPVLTGALWSWI